MGIQNGTDLFITYATGLAALRVNAATALAGGMQRSWLPGCREMLASDTAAEVTSNAERLANAAALTNECIKRNLSG
jgi:hypothetical protein